MSKNIFSKLNRKLLAVHFIVLVAFMFYACKNSDNQLVENSEIKEKIEASDRLLMHTVFLNLKDSISQEDKAYALNELKKLKDIPEVMSFVVGTKANTGDPRLNKTYDLVLQMSFKNIEELKLYDKDSLHSEVRKKLKNLLAGPPEVYDYWSN